MKRKKKTVRKTLRIVRKAICFAARLVAKAGRKIIRKARKGALKLFAFLMEGAALLLVKFTTI